MAGNAVFLKSVVGKHVAFTGSCAPWTRVELVHQLRKHRAEAQRSGDLNDRTSVLIRGTSGNWKHPDYGRKEADAAERIRSGQSILLVGSEDLHRLLTRGRPARRLEYVAGQPLEWLQPSSEKVFLSTTRFAGALDREYTTKGRREQSYLRRLLLGGRKTAVCEMCGEPLPSDLLAAAHIKPRAECSLRERRDARHIVLLLCLLGCDALYERGYVTVDDRGRYAVSKRSAIADGLMRRLPSQRKTCRAWATQTRGYFTWHRVNRFRAA